MALLSPTKAYLARPRRMMVSLTSQLTTIIISLSVYFFFAFNMLKFEYITKAGNEVIYMTGYEGFSFKYFGGYVNTFLILVCCISFIIICFMGVQLIGAFSIHGANIIMLGLVALSMEFLLDVLSLGGYILFAFLIVDLIQYFICLDKHDKVDIWLFFMVVTLIMVMLPSALAASSLFAS